MEAPSGNCYAPAHDDDDEPIKDIISVTFWLGIEQCSNLVPEESGMTHAAWILTCTELKGHWLCLF